MAEEEEEENKVPKVDPIVFLRDWFKTRVLSSLKCKEDLVNKLVDIEPSAAAVDSFWKESETQRLIVYFKDADLIAVRSNPTSHPPLQHGIIGDRPRPIAHYFIFSSPRSTNVTKFGRSSRTGPFNRSRSFADRPAPPSTPSTQTTNPPDKFKKKALCFLKLAPVKLDPDNVDSKVIFGDFGDAPLEHLSTVAQEVFLPVITNPRNQHGWPEVITKEVMENMHKFIASVYVTIGQTKGKTLLPMPPSESSGAGGADGASTTDQIHVLESAIVTWTRQIKGVLKTDPEQALNRDDGEHPGPLTELEFWEDKAANLNAIHEQLSGPKIRKVVTVLDVAKSSYFPAFQKLCKEVAHARVEANDNLLFPEAPR